MTDGIGDAFGITYDDETCGGDGIVVRRVEAAPADGPPSPRPPPERDVLGEVLWVVRRV